MAVPVTGPVPAGAPIVQALPVSQPTSDASVPVVQATPVAMPAAGAAVAWAESTSTSTGAPLATPMAIRVAGAAPVAEPLVRAERNWLFWGMAIVAAFLLLATVVILVVQRYAPPGRGQRGYAKGAAVQFKEVQPMPIMLYDGRKTPVIVTIQRKDSSGPVTVGFDKLPNGLQSEQITIKDSQDTDQLYLMASFNSGIRKVEIRLLAVAENLRDVIVVPVTVVTKKSAAKID